MYITLAIEQLVMITSLVLVRMMQSRGIMSMEESFSVIIDIIDYVI